MIGAAQAEPIPANPPKPVLKRKKNKTSSTHTQSGKVVVRNGGAKDDSEDLAPAMSTEQARNSRESTAQLLASTDQNLKNVAGRQFSPAQQNMLEEIHTYVRQSKGATDSGDLTRAHTLAYKALLLSGDPPESLQIAVLDGRGVPVEFAVQHGAGLARLEPGATVALPSEARIVGLAPDVYRLRATAPSGETDEQKVDLKGGVTGEVAFSIRK